MPLGKVPTLVKTPFVTSLLADTDAVNESFVWLRCHLPLSTVTLVHCVLKNMTANLLSSTIECVQQTGPWRRLRYTFGRCVNKWELLWNAGHCCT